MGRPEKTASKMSHIDTRYHLPFFSLGMSPFFSLSVSLSLSSLYSGVRSSSVAFRGESCNLMLMNITNLSVPLISLEADVSLWLVGTECDSQLCQISLGEREITIKYWQNNTQHSDLVG